MKVFELNGSELSIKLNLSHPGALGLISQSIFGITVFVENGFLVVNRVFKHPKASGLSLQFSGTGDGLKHSGAYGLLSQFVLNVLGVDVIGGKYVFAENCVLVVG